MVDKLLIETAAGSVLLMVDELLDEIVAGEAGQATMIQDTIGLEHERWNPVLRQDEIYVTTDPRKDFRR